MILTGRQMVERSIIIDGLSLKMDNSSIPSYGCDGALYTFRAMKPEHIALDEYVLGAGESVSLKTRETVFMPYDCIGLLFGKSTYTRKGIILVTNSPVDPGYRGKLTMRMFNSSEDDVYLDLRGGLMQMTVHKLDEITDMPYTGRWQGEKI